MRRLAAAAVGAFLVGLAPSAAAEARAGAGDSRSSSLKIELLVSAFHAAALVPIKKRRYRGAGAVDAVFSRLAREGDRFCKSKWRLQKKEPGRFVAPEYKRKVGHGRRGLAAMIAGCWNFFTMNDQRPDRDLRLVRKLFPAAKFECTTVGVSQAYLLDQHLSCEHMTMLDIDWRILDAHRQLLHLFAKRRLDGALPPRPRRRRRPKEGRRSNSKKGRRTSPVAASAREKQLATQLGQLRLSWLRYGALEEGVTPRAPERGVGGSLKNLCGRRMRPRCAHAYAAFQKHHTDSRRFTLQLAALHDITYKTEREDRVGVIYLSNALDPTYTTWKQSRQMLRGIAAGMRVGQRAILVHHVGGAYTFGLYQLRRKAKGYRLTTICKDEYQRARLREWIPYKLPLDHISRTRKPRTCKKLLRRHNIR